MLTAGYVGRSEARPAKPTLVYDGSCGFCRQWVGRVQRWDRAGHIRYLAYQDHDAPKLTNRPREALAMAMHVVRPDGHVYAGAAAARELFRYLPGGALPRLLLGLPGAMPVAERLYAWIARKWGPVGWRDG